MTKNRNLALLGILFSAQTMISCKPVPTFGEDLLKFVRNDLYGISVRMATEDLNARWMRSYQAVIMEVLSRLDAVESQTTDLENQLNTVVTSTPIQAFETATKSENDLLPVLRNLEAIEHLSTQLDTVCGAKHVFERAGLDLLGFVAPLGSVGEVPSDIRLTAAYNSDLGTGGSLIASGVDTLMQLLRDKDIKKQNEALRNAIKEYPDHVAKADQLFAISQTACNTALSQLAPIRGEVDTAVRGARAMVDSLRGYVAAVRQERSFAVASLIAKDTSTQSGTHAAQLASARLALEGRLQIDLQLSQNDLENKATLTVAECVKSRRAAAMELLDQTIGTRRLELTIVRSDTGWSPTVLSRLDEFESALERLSPGSGTQWKQLLERPCH